MEDRLREHGAIKPFIMLTNAAGTDDIYYPLLYDGIPNEFKTVALEELNETEENRRMGILKLREFLKKQDISDVKDDMLLIVLRNCKFSDEKSKWKLMKFLEIYSTVVERLQKTDMKRLENILDSKVMGFLPYRDRHGRAIIYGNASGIDFNLFDTDDSAICFFCLSLYALTFQLTTVRGISYISDCTPSSLSIVYPALKACSQYVHKYLGLPIRIGKVEVLNEFFAVRLSYKIASPFVSSKIIQRVQFHGSDIQNLQEFYHPTILPEEFGGTVGPLSNNFFKEDFFNFLKRLKSGD